LQSQPTGNCRGGLPLQRKAPGRRKLFHRGKESFPRPQEVFPIAAKRASSGRRKFFPSRQRELPPAAASFSHRGKESFPRPPQVSPAVAKRASSGRRKFCSPRRAIAMKISYTGNLIFDQFLYNFSPNIDYLSRRGLSLLGIGEFLGVVLYR
jgi:hypothetical protein